MSEGIESVTAVDVAPASNAITDRTRNGSVALTAGQSVYVDASDEWALADADAAGTAGDTAGEIGVTLSECNAGQPIAVQTGGDLDPGFTPTVGSMYALAGDTAGGILELSTLDSGAYVTLLGVGTTTTNLHLLIYPTEKVKP